MDSVGIIIVKVNKQVEGKIKNYKLNCIGIKGLTTGNKGNS